MNNLYHEIYFVELPCMQQERTLNRKPRQKACSKSASLKIVDHGEPDGNFEFNNNQQSIGISFHLRQSCAKNLCFAYMMRQK